MSANDKNLLRIGAAAIILLGAILACGPTPGGGGISVVINSPVDGSVVTVGQAVQIDSTSTSEAGIARVDLTVNGGMIRHDSPSQDIPPAFRIVQMWTPAEGGQVTISVVAYDTTGASAQATISLQVVAGVASQTTATPRATETPLTQPPVTTEAGCTLNSSYVADVTIPDGTVMSPGAGFVKTWRVRNSGTCDWEAGYTLIFVSGEQMSGPASVPLPAVAAGRETDISVNLAAPNAYGAFEGTWRMQAGDGTVFGTKLTVVIEVVSPVTKAPVTDTPTPTATSTPEKEVTAEPPGVTVEPPLEAPRTTRVFKQLSVSAGGSAQGVAKCPDGSIAVGGGYEANNKDLVVYAHYKYGEGWRGYVKSIGAGGEVQVYAICLSYVPVGQAATTQINSPVEVPANTAKAVVAACPADSVVTGGGWTATDETVQVYISRKSGNGWEVRARNKGTASKNIQAHAICLSGTKGTTTEVEKSVSIPGNSSQQTAANCPPGSLISGGGFIVEGNLSVFKSTDIGSDRWAARAWNNDTADKTLTTQAVCLSFP